MANASSHSHVTHSAPIPAAFQTLFEKQRRVVGLMSGTSLDGIDVAVADLDGSGAAMEINLIAKSEIAYPESIKAAILHNSTPETSSVWEISQLNTLLAGCYATAVRETLADAEIAPETIHLVGCHGQTIHHVPEPAPCAGMNTISTLQIGDPSILANLLGIPVVGDFRQADMALGGQGAPLVPYFDFVAFSDPNETRLLLNLGGIGNITMLPAGGRVEDTLAFDTGPGNMLIDTLARGLFGRPFDRLGIEASKGDVDTAALAALLGGEYFRKAPPKSTGREMFGKEYADRLEAHMPDASPNDLIATATALTYASVYRAYVDFIQPVRVADRLIVSGGGMHNTTIMRGLSDHFSPVPVHPVSDFHMDSDSKEALCFAVLAHEYLNGVPTNLPSVTGATRSTLLGKLCLPLPDEM